MFCCRRSPDPVPTEVSVPWITKSTHTYKKELDFLRTLQVKHFLKFTGKKKKTT
jgi:hypothetical protein